MRAVRAVRSRAALRLRPAVRPARTAAWPPGTVRAPWAARRPQRPGQAITGAVLAFVQAGLVLVASLYLWFFASVADAAVSGIGRRRRVHDGTGPGVARARRWPSSSCCSVGPARRRRCRSRSTGARRARACCSLAAHAVQVVLAVYWTVRLLMLLGDIPGDDRGVARR